MPDGWDDPDDQIGIWEAHLPALAAFLAVDGQWRTISRGIAGTHWLGLDYTAVETGLRLAEITVSPEVWAELRDIEAGATKELNAEK